MSTIKKPLHLKIKGTKKVIQPRKTKGCTNEKRIIKGGEPPYSTYAPGEGVQPPK